MPLTREKNDHEPSLRVPRPHFHVWLAALWMAGTGPALAVGAGKSFYFASREACYASSIFRKWECDNAFANATAQVRDRAPTFAARFECQLRFQLCERRVEAAPEDSAGPIRFGPTLLGVEIFGAPGGVMTAPVLAVANPPGLFRASPITRLALWESRPARGGVNGPLTPILPADRFLPLSSAGTGSGLSPVGDGLPRIERRSVVEETRDRKSLTERRERLKSAPFVE